MDLYFSKSLGGGFRVGTRIGVRSKRDGCFIVTLIQGIASLILIVLFIAYWQIGVLLLVIWFVVTVVWAFFGIDFKQQRENLELAGELCIKAQKHVDLTHDSKTLAARLNNCSKSILLLQEIEELDPKGKIMQNGQEMMEYLTSLQKVLPIGDIIDKAERSEFKGQSKRALNYYLDALFHCKKNNIDDNDFINAEIHDEESDDYISIQYLMDKARSNGWCE